MSTLEPSKDVLADTKPADNLSQSDSVDAGLSELVQMARQSFEEKRRKQSLSLTSAILKIDPENKEALVIQSWVRQDLQKQLTNARARLAEAHREKSLDLYDQAERLLRGILNVDPQSEEATTLLAEVVPAQRAAAEVLAREPEPDLRKAPVSPTRGKGGRQVALVVGILVAVSVAFGLFKLGNHYKSQADQTHKVEVAETKPAPAPTPSSTAATGSYELVVVPATGVQLTVDDSEPKAVPKTIELPPGPHRLVFTAKGYSPQTITETVVAGEYHVLPVVMNFAPDANAPSSPPSSGPSSARASSAPPAPSPERTANAKPDAGEPVGVLALSAAVPVDVYFAGKQLGTTPVTVQLPAGLRTLEYRYQDLTKTTTLTIKSGQTTTETIVFDVKLQINARPWAQVSIEGPEGRALGQTPLSNVTVPAGSVLVFQNPRFPEKKIRVTGRDSAVQVVFP